VGAGALVALSLALLNAIVPPIFAALRLPFMVAIGFILVLLVDAALQMLIDDAFSDWIRVDSFGDALLTALLISAVSMLLRPRRAGRAFSVARQRGGLLR
jgi:uncharacterized membrane protein YvlD (DUF360 family)